MDAWTAPDDTGVEHADGRPPTGPEIRLITAGTWWDAVKVPEYLGAEVLRRTGDGSGAVLRDPYASRLYFFTRPHLGACWTGMEIAGVQVLSVGCYVAMPPGYRVSGPGPHWLRPVTDVPFLTDAGKLWAVLTEEAHPNAGSSSEAHQ